MHKTIIVGYGNIDRADDGAAYVIINRLREELGQKILDDNETGLEDLSGKTDSIFLPQLLPETMDVLTSYERIIFVDAHVGDDKEDLNCIKITPELHSSSFTHHMTPEMILAFLDTLYQHKPDGHLVSIHGYDFDFKRVLSPQTKSLVKPAVERILHLIGQ